MAYFAAGLDAALWSYAYPYQRRLLARAVEWAAREPAPLRVKAPLCVQATSWTQDDGKRLIVHLFNGINTTANHGLPAADVPLREEVVPIHGIEVRLRAGPWRRFRMEPGGIPVETRKDGDATVLEPPPLHLHAMLLGEV